MMCVQNSTSETMDLFHNDVKRRKRDIRRNLIGLKRTSIIAEPIKFRVSSCMETAFDVIMKKVY